MARPQPTLYTLPRLFPEPRDPPSTGSSLHRHGAINHTALWNFLLLLKRDAWSRQTPRVCEWWGPTWGFLDLLVMGDSPTRPSPAAGSSPSLWGPWLLPSPERLCGHRPTPVKAGAASIQREVHALDTEGGRLTHAGDRPDRPGGDPVTTELPSTDTVCVAHTKRMAGHRPNRGSGPGPPWQG